MTGTPVSRLNCSNGPCFVTASPTSANVNPSMANRPLNSS